MTTVPRVSIGLAVRNGEEYLEAAIDSILCQSFEDFELIVSDNASTDRTEEIVQTFAARDRRVRYHRNAVNIGGANNENQTFRMARGEYFRWAAHDDLLAPRLLERLVAILDSDPAVILAHASIIEIDEHGKELRLLTRNRATSRLPHERFRDMAVLDHNCEEIYGLMRSAALHKTDLQLNYTDSDRTLLCQLSLFGQFQLVAEPLFFRRIHPKMSTQVYSDWRARMAWFRGDDRQHIDLPHWSQLGHYFKIIATAPIPVRERALCYRHLVTSWLIHDQQARAMARDVVVAIPKIPSSLTQALGGK